MAVEIRIFLLYYTEVKKAGCGGGGNVGVETFKSTLTTFTGLNHILTLILHHQTCIEKIEPLKTPI